MGMENIMYGNKKQTLNDKKSVVYDDDSDSPDSAPPSLATLDRNKKKTLKTPERIEYYTESEVEESEVDQAKHNLSASMLSLDGSDSDSSDIEIDDELSDNELESLAQLYG